ncbi:VapA/VapB family virulence-associated protein [Bacillus cereus]|uniref:VapA/VapB family virulence-associated protein n=1 Tax=Bacillus cereus TaxID=1396 RepID=UPI003D16323B
MNQQNSESQQEINERVSKDLKQLLDGKLPTEKMNNIIKASIIDRTYYAELFEIGALFYLHYEIWTPHEDAPYAKFEGNAGGLGILTSQRAVGNIYTKDIEALINNTTSFAFISAVVYFSVYFFDTDHNLLGHFQAGGIGIGGPGGGTGKWTRLNHPLENN